MPFKERLEKTAVIVRGRAGKTISSKHDGPDGSVVSITDIELTEVLKGDVGVKALRVSQPGGDYRGITTHVEGVAKFIQDQDVVLFLAAGERGVYSIPSLELGQYTVVIDDQGREILSGVGYPEGEKPWTLADARAALAGKNAEQTPGPAAVVSTPVPGNGPGVAMTLQPTPEGASAATEPASTSSGIIFGVLAAVVIGVWAWISRNTKKPPGTGGGSP